MKPTQKLKRIKHSNSVNQPEQFTGIRSSRFMLMIFIMAAMTGYTASVTNDWKDMQQINVYFE